MDAQNTLFQHFLVGVLSIALAALFAAYLGTGWSTAFGRAAFILLFLTLFIGPFTKLRKPDVTSTPMKSPWYWRSELGIWFTITALIHVYFAMTGHPEGSFLKALGGFIGGQGYGLANLLGFIALAWGIVLAATSFKKVIQFLGIESWKWLHKFTYVVFYLVVGHLLYFQFFTTYGSGPDWFGYAGLVMMGLIILMQLAAFVKTVKRNHPA